MKKEEKEILKEMGKLGNEKTAMVIAAFCGWVAFIGCAWLFYTVGA